ncbi:hypothetical protein CP556_09950 [Natrinema sp. CBA1119]|uniref:hypothetical protein n=1 Tax=Natrinema sp. CBA1119 TaxID=1608465 RepID=UPI000BF63F0A|nr:hypothetical protein [Natrinema sp. CBA1119]PGF16406.1 hypothetical protein CP556_09950 [Natrinema sp. CBA1119]
MSIDPACDPDDLEEALEAGETTISRAAELAELTVWELQQFIREHDITWIDENGLESDLQEL